MRRPQHLLDAIAGVLERSGIIDARRFKETYDLSWPRIITGFAIMSKQAVDLALVGIAVGSTAVAGLAFAGAYWKVGKFLGIGLAGGTVSLVSQNYGGGESERASVIVKQSVWLALAFALPVVCLYWLYATPLIAVLGSNPDAIRYGSTYLVLVAPALLFDFLNLIASRTYAGIGDTFTPMVLRAGGAVLNVVISATLIFGVEMGVAGAAIGTTVSTGFVLVLLAWGMFGRSYGDTPLEKSPVSIHVAGPQFDGELVRQLLRVSSPLMARRTAEGLVVFPLLWVASTFGPIVVAAFEVGRRVRDLINSFSWGFSITSSTLVGQALGGGDEPEAEAYGAAIIRLSLLVYLVVAALVIVFAKPIAGVFVSGVEEVSAATTFVRLGALSAITLGIDGSATGVLRGAGDTTWPFAASLLGRYGFALPVAVLAAVTPVGILGLYVSLLLETLVPSIVNVWRFKTNRWKAVSRAYRPSAEPDSPGS